MNGSSTSIHGLSMHIHWRIYWSEICELFVLYTETDVPRCIPNCWSIVGQVPCRIKTGISQIFAASRRYSLDLPKAFRLFFVLLKRLAPLVERIFVCSSTLAVSRILNNRVFMCSCRTNRQLYICICSCFLHGVPN